MMSLHNFRRQNAGSALIITLSLLVLLTIILVVSLATVQFSGQLSRTRFDSYTSRQFSVNGLNQAVSLLRYGTGDKNKYWVSQGGAITLFPLGATDVEILPLHSGVAVNATEGVNLNAPAFQSPDEGAIANPSSTALFVKWIYVRENGQMDKDATYDGNNRIIGRYAFWVDDESSKVNINTAGDGSATGLPANDLTLIQLGPVFPEFNEQDLHSVVSARSISPFNSLLSMLRAFGADAPAHAETLRKEKFNLTHHNASPAGETYFGQPKIVLTTKPEQANGRPFLDISTPEKTAETVNRMIDYMSRTDWPMAPGHSFQEKFYNGNKGDLTQLAVNIIDYVRAKETPPDASNQDLMVGLSGWLDGNAKWVPASSASTGFGYAAIEHREPQDPSYHSVCRTVYITELGLWRNTASPDNGRFYATLHLPKHGGLSQIDLSKLYYYAWGIGAYPIGTGILKAGDYITVSYPFSFWNGPESRVLASPYSAYVNVQLCTNTSYWSTRVMTIPYANANLWLPITESAPDPDNPGFPPALTLAALRTIQIDDPVMGSVMDFHSPNGYPSGNWQDGPATGHTLGKRPSVSTLGQAPSNVLLEQDVDSSGQISDASFVFPAPAGVVIPNSPSSNPNGIVESLGELGFIHVGVQRMPESTGAPKNIPWKTLRLQPRHPSIPEGTLPDWALLDLFALPRKDATADRSKYPSEGAIAGLVNVNREIIPFTDLQRVNPLLSALKNSSDYSDELMESIVQGKLSDTTRTKGRSFSTNSVFLMPGQLAEIKGVSDSGEESEKFVREVIGLVTTRGNIFTVSSIGQSVIQLRDGNLKVRGETRLLSMVERYKEGENIKFRTIFSRPLSP